MSRLVFAAAVLGMFLGSSLGNRACAQRAAATREPSAAAPAARPAVKIFTLQNAAARQMQRIVNELFGPAGSARGTRLGIRTSFDPRTNSLIVVGSTDDLAVIEALVQRLDESHAVRRPPGGTEIRVSIRAPTDSPLQVASVVAAGQRVKQGDLLLAIDPAGFVELIEAQRIQVERTRAALAQDEVALKNRQLQGEAAKVETKLRVEVAKLELKEYQEGTRPLQLKTYKQEVHQAELDLERIQRLVEAGEADAETLARHEAELERAKTQLDVFQNFTVTKTLTELESNIAAAERQVEQALNEIQTSLPAAEAALAARRAQLEVERQRLAKLQEGLEGCRIAAPHDGVVAAAPAAIREGSQVREGQIVLILVPASDEPKQ